MGWLSDFTRGWKESIKSYEENQGIYRDEYETAPPEQPLSLIGEQMKLVGAPEPSLPPAVRLAMYNANRPPNKQVKLYGSALSQTRHMDICDTAGLPYGGGESYEITLTGENQ